MSETPDNIVPLTPKAVSTMEAFLAEHERELLTILFTDLVDSTQLQSELGNAEAARLVQIHRRLVRDELEKHNSREVEWAGDSCLAVFSMPSDGVRFALTMQAAMRRARRDEPNLPRVRVGLHLGEIFVHKQRRGAKKTEELFGLQVSEASRVMSLASGDQIYMSRPVYDNARSSMKGSATQGIGDISWINHGPFILKGSDEQVEVCEVGEQGHAPLAPPEANDKCRPASASREIEVITPEVVPPRTGGPSRSVIPVVLASIVLTALVTGTAVWMLTRPEPLPPPEPAPVQRFSIAPDNEEALEPGFGTMAVSPDGSRLIYVGGSAGASRLVVRDIDRHEVRFLSGTEGAQAPFISPDGQWIAFFSMGKLRKVSVHGGAVLTLCDSFNQRGGTWGPDDTIIFAPGTSNALVKVPAAGGTPEPLTTLAEGELSHRWPQFLPGGRAVLFTIKTSQNLDDAGMAVVSLDTGEYHTVLSGGSYARYAMSGHVLFGHAGTLMAFPFDLETLQRTGPPGPAIDGVVTDPGTGAAAYAHSDNGLIVYVPGESGGNNERSILSVDMDGKAETLSVPRQQYFRARFSPDATRLALEFTSGAGTRDIWIYDRARGTPTRFTFESTNLGPLWTPDGRRIVFSSAREGNALNLYWKPSDGSGPAERLLTHSQTQLPLAISPDGMTVLFMQINPDTGNDLMVMSLEGDPTPRPFLETPFAESSADFSPDGRWVVYDSNESGRNEIFVRPFPGPGGKWQVSRDGGHEPVWSRDGSRIYFLNGDKMMGANVETSDVFSALAPEVVFQQRYYDYLGRQYDLAPDGDSFLMLESLLQVEGTATFRVVTNWFTELERLVPTTKR